MRIGSSLVAAAAGVACVMAIAQSPPSTAPQGTAVRVCECGKHPPGPPRDRVVQPYAGEPADLSPYEKFAKPYDLNYIRPNIYVGSGRDIPDPKGLTEVRIGFFGPIEHSPEREFGQRRLRRRPADGREYLGFTVGRDGEDGLRRS